MIPPARTSEQGNILVYILVGIVLIGLLTVALRQSGDVGKDIDQEQMSIRATEVQRYAAQIQQAVGILIGNQISESDLRFAHPKAPSAYGSLTATPQNQIFSKQGGNVSYQLVPSGINDGSKWEFYATTDAPQVGSDKADLIAVLPNVTESFCTAINRQLGYTGAIPVDASGGSTPDCVYSSTSAHKFTSGNYFASPNTMTTATFSRLPAYQGCVSCGAAYHYFYVLMAR